MKTQKETCFIVAGLVLLMAFSGCSLLSPTSETILPSYAPPQDVEAALEQAGDNRDQLEAVLTHYHDRRDSVKLKAAEFLIANMPDHSFVQIGWVGANGEELDFDALDYANYEEALTAMEQLEKQHGEINYKKTQQVKDIEVATTNYLIENIDLAVEVWQTKPWAKDLPFEYFCDYILPYRGSNEPLSDWRKPLMTRYLDAADGVKGDDTVKTITGKMQKDVHKVVRFSSLYYMHPTDQSFDEMCVSRTGRCEDITNMMTYAMRANGFASASDYTPAWADRDNNHAWQVVLDADGKANAGLTNRAAKIYRKTFSTQKDSLGNIKGEDVKVPRWLSGRHYIDVTDEYMTPSDVTIALTNEPNEPTPFAYLCVFNGGRWTPIHWAKIQNGQATFTKMGRDIAYLPVYYVQEQLQPAAAPFILHKDGRVQTLNGGTDETTDKFEITTTKPVTADADTLVDFPRMVVKPGKAYELFVWDDNKWTTVAKTTAKSPSLVAEVAAGNRLFWCVEQGGRKLERIFLLEDNQQIMY